MIISALHSADVVPVGRRREVRRQYRIDVPIEFAQASRRDVEPAIEIDFANRGTVVLSSFAGRLWMPHVPEARRENPRSVDLPGPHAETHAMTEQEFAAFAGGEARRGRWGGSEHDDPLERCRGINDKRAERWIPARDLPTLADEPVKSTLWSDRAATERRLRQAAERILIVDGKVWTELDEPALALGANVERTRREISVWLSVGRYTPRAHALGRFRLDRMDDILDWAEHQGRIVVPLSKPLEPFVSSEPPFKSRAPEIEPKDDTVPIMDRYRIVGTWRPERDDARVVLAERSYRPMTECGALVSLLPSTAVDAFIALKRFWLQSDECDASTPELYGHLKTLAGAIDALSGLSEEEFDRRRKAREGISPLLARWHSHEEARYAPVQALAP